MHRGRPVDFHKTLVEFRRQEGQLKKLLSVPRPKLERRELLIKLRDVRGEISRIEYHLHTNSMFQDR